MELETALEKIGKLEETVSALEVRLDNQFELTKDILRRLDSVVRGVEAGRFLPSTNPCVTPAIQPILLEKTARPKTGR